MTLTGISMDAEVNGLQLHGAFVESFDQTKTLYLTQWLSSDYLTECNPFF